MQATFHFDEFGRLVCELSHAGSVAIATAREGKQAMFELRRAVESLTHAEQSEVWWSESAGEYRWVFRRVDNTVRVAVMWSAGTVTGWEHVFWGECPLIELLESVLSAEPTNVRP